MKLLVGLGNPGAKYTATRHNAGFWFADRVVAAARASFSAERKFHGELAKLSSSAGELWALKPETFMNKSGLAVGALANFYKVAPADVVVAHDELDLPPGGAKLKFGGGISGHNGLRDIVAVLGTQDFWRLRIGIGHPRDQAQSAQEVIDYVLHPPRQEEQAAIDDCLARALDLWPLIARHDMEAAMLKLHTKEAPKP